MTIDKNGRPHDWGRPKIFRPCAWCSQSFSAQEMLKHRPVCPQRPEKAPRGGWDTKQTCRWCGTEMASHFVQRHWRRHCTAIPVLGEDEFPCTFCQQIKPRSEFPPLRPSTLRFDWTCLPCKAKYQSEYMKRTGRTGPNRPRPKDEGTPEGKRRMVEVNLRQNYGLTMETYERMMATQGGLCAICGQADRGFSKTHGRLNVDHCHDTGYVRALLCPKCNVGLGAFADNPEWLRKAADYIDRFNAKFSWL